MRADLPRIYPITDQRLSRLSHTDQVKHMIRAGATVIQLREKHASPRAFFSDAAECVSIAHAANVKLIINDRVDIALALSADGVHLGQTDMPADAARTLLGDKAIIGLSTHKIDQVEQAIKMPIDYIAFGPVFPTRTKANAEAVAGLHLLRTASASVGSLPLVAIGGITRERIADVLAAGADALAVISLLFTPPANIAENLRTFSILANEAALRPWR